MIIIKRMRFLTYIPERDKAEQNDWQLSFLKALSECEEWFIVQLKPIHQSVREAIEILEAMSEWTMLLITPGVSIESKMPFANHSCPSLNVFSSTNSQFSQQLACSPGPEPAWQHWSHWRGAQLCQQHR